MRKGIFVVEYIYHTYITHTHTQTYIHMYIYTYIYIYIDIIYIYRTQYKTHFKYADRLPGTNILRRFMQFFCRSIHLKGFYLGIKP